MKHMLHGTLLALMLAGLAPIAVTAHSTDEELRDAVRQVLVDNPELIVEAIDEIRARREQAESDAVSSWLADNRAAVFNDGYSVVGGNPAGDVTLVEYFDYRCGFCRKAFDEVWAFLEADGNVRYVLKEFPILGEASVVAAQASIAAAEQDDGEQFFAYHQALLEHGGSLDERSVLAIAEEHGYDSARIQASMSAEKIDDIIKRNHQTARQLGISGTPAFVMGDEIRAGYLDRSQLSEWAQAVRDGSTE